MAFKVKLKSFYIWKSFIFFQYSFPFPSLLLQAPKLQHAWIHTACAHIHMHTPTSYAEVLEVDCHHTSFLCLECSTQSTTIPSSFGLYDSVQNTRMLCLVPLSFRGNQVVLERPLYLQYSSVEQSVVMANTHCLTRESVNMLP